MGAASSARAVRISLLLLPAAHLLPLAPTRSGPDAPAARCSPRSPARCAVVLIWFPLQRLIKWAAAGKIAPVPDSWKSTYA